MKKLIGKDVGSYTFSASTKEVTLSGLTNIDKEQILLITNVIDNEMIYMFNDSSLGGTLTQSGPNYILTLTYDTTSMSNADRLQIYIDYLPDRVQIIGGNDNLAEVNNLGELKVSTESTIPISATKIEITGYGDVSGSSYNDTNYVIPNSVELNVYKFYGGSEGSNSSKVELYYVPTPPLNDSASNGTLIKVGYVSNNNFEFGLNDKYTGNGTSSIVMRRRRLDGTTKEIYGRWIGYY